MNTLLNGFNDGLHASSGIGGKPPFDYVSNNLFKEKMEIKKIEFCCKQKCPIIEYTEDSNMIVLGDANGPEGITTWSKEQFKDFVLAAKEGKFDIIYE
jgi:hypothetical protein